MQEVKFSELSDNKIPFQNCMFLFLTMCLMYSCGGDKYNFEYNNTTDHLKLTVMNLKILYQDILLVIKNYRMKKDK